MFRDLLDRYQLKFDDKKKSVLAFLLILLSLFSTEMLYQYFIFGLIKNVLMAFIPAFVFAGIISLLYLIIPKIRYILLLIGGIVYNLIMLAFTICYDINGFVPRFRELFYSSLQEEVFSLFKFDYYYLGYLIPIIILCFVPFKFKMNLRLRLKVVLNYITIPYLTLVLCCFIPFKYQDKNYYEKYFDTSNSNFLSYHYGASLTLLNNFVYEQEAMTNLSIDEYFNSDTIPNSGYNSKAYQNKNLIMIDVMGLDYKLITEEVMPFLFNQLKTSTYSTNFYSVPTPIKEQAYFMMDTGLYYDTDCTYNFYHGLKSVRNHNLTKVFKQNGYETLYYSNSDPYSYQYAKESGFDDVNYYDTNNLTVISELLNKLTPTHKIYARVTLSNEDVDSLEIDERYQDDEEIVAKYKLHMEEVNYALISLFNHLVTHQLLDKTIIVIMNSTMDERLYGYVNQDKEDNSRASLDFYKAPLIFMDGMSSKNEVYASFVDVYSGIIDSFGLYKGDIEKTSGYSIFHNPLKTVRFMDGSVTSEEFIYYAKSDDYKVKNIIYLTPVVEDVMKNKIKHSEKMYKLSQNIQNNYYFHLNSV